jgi:hypothetical protein
VRVRQINMGRCWRKGISVGGSTKIYKLGVSLVGLVIKGNLSQNGEFQFEQSNLWVLWWKFGT